MVQSGGHSTTTTRCTATDPTRIGVVSLNLLHDTNTECCCTNSCTVQSLLLLHSLVSRGFCPECSPYFILVIRSDKLEAKNRSADGCISARQQTACLYLFRPNE